MQPMANATLARTRKPDEARGPATPGVIRADEVYTLREFQSRTRLGTWAMRQGRRSGLKVIDAHGRSFVRGADWFAYLERQAECETAD
jgi:hypothetical protein